ncbi:MAG TPA: YajG family lipoprotein [Thermoanaerobaculia bacterium]
MSAIRLRSTLFLLMLALAGAAYGRGATPKELVVNLKFKPQEEVHSSTANIPPSMLEKSVAIHIVEKRNESDAKVIGQGTGGDDKTFPIKAAADIKPFLEETLESVAKSFGLKVSEKGGDRTLVVTVTRFFIDEGNKALGSVYSSEVKLAYTLKTSGGKTLTEGATTGSAHRYGRAHSEQNINEVLSDALKEAFANVLDESKLQDAWAGKK